MGDTHDGRMGRIHGTNGIFYLHENREYKPFNVLLKTPCMDCMGYIFKWLVISIVSFQGCFTGEKIPSLKVTASKTPDTQWLKDYPPGN